MFEKSDISTILSKKGCKNTKSRQAVFEVLKKRQVPLSVEEIFMNVKEMGISINLSTVYRNLELMENKGLIEKTIMNDGKARFELTGNGHKHHLICTNCNKTISFDVCPLEKYEKKLKSETQFDITGHQLILYGLCPDCKKGK